ncbi:MULTISPECIES: hypothetical protein [Methylobacterium]|uniref:hypothetical protein n=1 Tax=Methylobacterium TaxID=407 RepID=UPI000A4BC046|nr:MULTISPECIES: hypothetical protein [Methylobacterium]MCI9882178.1 hypothetical protein [Methylobacterium goesingense]
MSDENLPPQSCSEVDWDRISERYHELSDILQLFRVPTYKENEAYEGGLLVGMKHRDGLLFKKYEHSYYISLGTGPWMSRAQKLSKEINQKHKDETSVPDFIEVINWRDEIEKAIESRRVTMNFLEAWWRFGALFGSAVELDELSEQSQKYERTKTSAGSKADNSAREVWYARWLTDNGVFVRKHGPSRTSVEMEFAQFCRRIVRGELECPLRPDFFNKKWFDRLSVIDKEGLPVVRSGFKRLSKSKILKLSRSEKFPRHLLPPLSELKFRKNSKA